MPSQQAPRHRRAPVGSGSSTRSHRRIVPGRNASHRTVLIAAGSVFCAVFAFALATLPGHRSTAGPRPGQVGVVDDSARFAEVENPTIAPPASISRDQRRHPATVSALPQLGENAPPGAPRSSSHPPRAGGSGAPGSSGSGSSGSASAPGSPSGTSNAPTGGAPSTALPDPAQLAHAVFDAINASRRDAGLRPLRWDNRLQSSAQQHNQSMANANTLSHQTPGEPDLGDRESNAGVYWWWAGENIGMSGALTQQAALDLEAAMVNEQPPNDGHRQNILSSRAQAVGVAVMLDTAHHRLWLTEDFAQTSLL